MRPPRVGSPGGSIVLMPTPTRDHFPILLVAAIAAACSSTVTSGSSTATSSGDASVCVGPVTDAGDTAACPSDRPTTGEPCSPRGLFCDTYGSISQQVTATCSSTCAWTVTWGPVFGADGGP